MASFNRKKGIDNKQLKNNNFTRNTLQKNINKIPSPVPLVTSANSFTRRNLFGVAPNNVMTTNIPTKEIIVEQVPSSDSVEKENVN